MSSKKYDAPLPYDVKKVDLGKEFQLQAYELVNSIRQTCKTTDEVKEKFDNTVEKVDRLFQIHDNGKLVDKTYSVPKLTMTVVSNLIYIYPIYDFKESKYFPICIEWNMG